MSKLKPGSELRESLKQFALGTIAEMFEERVCALWFSVGLQDSLLPTPVN